MSVWDTDCTQAIPVLAWSLGAGYISAISACNQCSRCTKPHRGDLSRVTMGAMKQSHGFQHLLGELFAQPPQWTHWLTLLLHYFMTSQKHQGTCLYLAAVNFCMHDPWGILQYLAFTGEMAQTKNQQPVAVKDFGICKSDVEQMHSSCFSLLTENPFRSKNRSQMHGCDENKKRYFFFFISSMRRRLVC